MIRANAYFENSAGQKQWCTVDAIDIQSVYQISTFGTINAVVLESEAQPSDSADYAEVTL